MSTWFIGDIHGQLGKLEGLMRQVLPLYTRADTLVFLGDYIDRGPSSAGVVEFLVQLSKRVSCVFLTGNHEDILQRYQAGMEVRELWARNGGKETALSYGSQLGGGQLSIPEAHMAVLQSGKYVYEGADCLAVHAGISPEYYDHPLECPNYSLMWVRDVFYNAPLLWPKTIIFGHTPSFKLGAKNGEVYFDKSRNIIGVDTGAAYDGPLSALQWPEGHVKQAY